MLESHQNTTEQPERPYNLTETSQISPTPNSRSNTLITPFPYQDKQIRSTPKLTSPQSEPPDHTTGTTQSWGPTPAYSTASVVPEPFVKLPLSHMPPLPKSAPLTIKQPPIKGRPTSSSQHLSEVETPSRTDELAVVSNPSTLE